jgi:hypothetical protein
MRLGVAAARAADAFRAKDFNRVVELLLPHAERLTPSERAKLAYGRAWMERDCVPVDTEPSTLVRETAYLPALAADQ